MKEKSIKGIEFEYVKVLWLSHKKGKCNKASTLTKSIYRYIYSQNKQIKSTESIKTEKVDSRKKKYIYIIWNCICEAPL